jgi:hypothetical protein
METWVHARIRTPENEFVGFTLGEDIRPEIHP